MMSLRISTEEYKALVLLVLIRDGYKCRACRVRNNLSAHHIQYRSSLGEDTLENLATLCQQCHDALHRGDLAIVPCEGNVEPYDANFELTFKRLNGWKPK